MKRIFLDANLLVDYVSRRANKVDEEYAKFIIEYCYEYSAKAFVSSHSIMVLYHKVDTEFDDKSALKEKLEELCELFNVIAVDEQDFNYAFKSYMEDFEDAVQVSCAVKAKADVIVTRNFKDFYGENIPIIITPDGFLDYIDFI